MDFGHTKQKTLRLRVSVFFWKNCTVESFSFDRMFSATLNSVSLKKVDSPLGNYRQDCVSGPRIPLYAIRHIGVARNSVWRGAQNIRALDQDAEGVGEEGMGVPLPSRLGSL